MKLIDPVGAVNIFYYLPIREKSFAPTVMQHMQDIKPQYPIESFGEHEPGRKHHRPSNLEQDGFGMV